MSCDKCRKKIEMMWVLMLTSFSFRNKNYQQGNKYMVEKFIADYLTFNKVAKIINSDDVKNEFKSDFENKMVKLNYKN
jgi:hypothetical protein